MKEILEVNDRLNEGKVSIEQARALTANFKSAINLIGKELDAAKFTGRLDKTIERWFHRVHQSAERRPESSEVLSKLQALLKEEVTIN